MLGRLFDMFVSVLLRMICSVDDTELRERLPQKGPLILIFNHISFIEAPVFYLFMRPRRIYGIVKSEISRMPVISTIARRWGAIPIKRGASPGETFRLIGDLLSEGAVIGLAPEGTRSGDGILQEGNPGVVTLAVKNDVPVIPVAHYGTEKLWKNLVRFRRTRIVFRVGEPFRLVKPEKTGKTERHALTRAMMVQLAALLPEEMRGPYGEVTDDDRRLIIIK